MADAWTSPMFIVTAIAAVAGVVAALASGLTLCVAYAVFLEAERPDVIVYATPDPSRPSIILLIIENLGRRHARDVQFQTSRPLPARAWGLGVRQSPSTVPLMTNGPIIHGIPYLAPRAKRIISLGQYPALYAALGDEPVSITVTYRGDAIAWIPGRPYDSTTLLEVRSFEMSDAVDPDGSRQSARELKRIAEILEALNERLATSDLSLSSDTTES